MDYLSFETQSRWFGLPAPDRNTGNDLDYLPAAYKMVLVLWITCPLKHSLGGLDYLPLTYA